MKLLLSTLALTTIMILTGCGSDDTEAPAEVMEVIIEESITDIISVDELPVPEDIIVVTVDEDTTVLTIEEAIVAVNVDTVIDEPFIEDEPATEPPIVVEDAPIVEPIACAEVPPIEEIEEFVPFTYPLPVATSWIAADYQAVADQEVIYKCDYRVHEGKIYIALRNYNAYPDEFNTAGNPFTIVNKEFYTGASFLRPKSNEPTCTEKVVFTSAEDINHRSYAYRGWYSIDVYQTEGCSAYPDLPPYHRIGQFATDLYGISAYGWTFAIEGVRYGRYQRDYETIPTPASPQDADFWEEI